MDTCYALHSMKAHFTHAALTDPEVLEQLLLAEAEVAAALALLDGLGVRCDVLLELLLEIGLEVALGTLEFLQFALRRLQTCKTHVLSVEGRHTTFLWQQFSGSPKKKTHQS